MKIADLDSLNDNAPFIPLGIHKLGTKPIPARGKTLKYPLGKVLGDYLYVGDKPGGVEPGFLAVKIDEDFRKRFNHFFSTSLDLISCKEYIESHITKKSPLDSHDPNLKPELLAKIHPDLDIQKIQAFAAMLAKEVRSKAILSSDEKKLDLFLFKQDYNDSLFGVSPPKERLAKTNAMQSINSKIRPLAVAAYKFGRKTDPYNENMNAILECFANDVARAYGMVAQEQALVLGTYQNGYPKFLTACKWEPEFKPIDTNRLHGSEGKKYENYLTDLDVEPNNHYYKADRGIVDKGQCLALFISQGDRDVFGSTGQNKGYKENRLFGFDFGHAYRGKNPLLASLTDSFNVTQPKNKNEKFKNLSICDDAPLSDKMAGMFFLYKMMSSAMQGKCFSKQERESLRLAINEYSKDLKFKNWYEKIPDNGFEKIYKAYESKFQELIQICKQNADKFVRSDPRRSKMLLEQSKEYTKYLNDLSQAYNLANKTHEKMFEIFKSRMQCSPREINLLRNVEMLTSKTSLTSSNGKVVLNHLRLSSDKRTPWKLEKDNEENLILSADFSNKNQKQMQKSKAILHEFSSSLVIEDVMIGKPPKPTIKIVLDSDLAKKFSKEDNIINFKARKNLIKQEVKDIHDMMLQKPILKTNVRHENQEITTSSSNTKPARKSKWKNSTFGLFKKHNVEKNKSVNTANFTASEKIGILKR